MKRTRRQIEQQLRADAPGWADQVQRESRPARPRAAPRAPLQWAVAAGLILALLAGLGIWWQGHEPTGAADPAIAQRDPVTIPAVRLPALPEARPVPLWSSRQLLGDTVRSVEEPYTSETQRLAADMKRALNFLREAVPVPATRGG